jgi:tripartite-type tricarboxylate transporter receptor subunit TctC
MDFARRRFLSAAVGAAAMPSVSRAVRAQSYPPRPVRLVAPFGPGGVADIVARLMSQKLSERFDKQFYVDNVPGASGNIGTVQVAKAPPDGMTILIAFSSFTVNPNLFAKLSYDPRKDFAPVTLAATSPTVLAVHPSVPANTVQDLVALIRANRGKYSYASAGAGTTSHLVAEQFRLSLGLDLVAVPYNGGGPATAAVVAGHTLIGFTASGPPAPQIMQGNIRALAVTSVTRSPAFAAVATFAQAGYPDIRGDNWVGVLVPAATPNEIVSTLHRACVDALSRPDIKDRFEAAGLDPVGSSPEAFAAQIDFELEDWGRLIKAANIKP